ncbi:MAG: OmpH family outer membrane protein [Thermoguttaceae bacterium]
MSKYRFVALAAICLFSLILLDAKAQPPMTQVRTMGPMQAGFRPNIALLDVSYLIKHHPRYKAMIDALMADGDKFEAEVNHENASIRQLGEKLNTYRQGSPEHKQMEEEIARRQADLTVKVKLQRNDFLQREAKIYHSVYKEIAQEVEHYCANNNIDMVLKFNGDPVDVDKPGSILSYINKQVVWYDKNRDITPIILDAVRKRNGAQGGNQLGIRQTMPGGGYLQK